MTWLGSYTQENWQAVADACEDFFKKNTENGDVYKLVMPQTNDAEGYRQAFSTCYADRESPEIIIHTGRAIPTYYNTYHRMYFGLTDEGDLIMGTFSKSLASIGGFIAGDADTINFLRHSCRTYIFSASDTPAATAAALEALHILQEEPSRLEHLWDVTNYALKRFKEEGFEIGDTESPIIPLYVRDIEKTFMVTKLAFDNGVFINPVIPPACAPQDTLVRFALMASHTQEQVERGVQILKKAFKELEIIK